MTLFINLCNVFPSLSLFFSAAILFCVLNLIFGYNHCDWVNANTRFIIFNFNSILTWIFKFSKWITYIYLSKKLGTNFLTLPTRVLYKSAIFSWYLESISLLISILSGAKGKWLCNSRNCLRYSRSAIAGQWCKFTFGTLAQSGEWNRTF